MSAPAGRQRLAVIGQGYVGLPLALRAAECGYQVVGYDLDAGQFSVLEQGNSKPVLAFENHNAPFSVALLFDTTGSMANTLPLLKAAAMQLVDDLRPADSGLLSTERPPRGSAMACLPPGTR